MRLKRLLFVIPAAIALLFASKKQRVIIIDTNNQVLKTINQGIMPYKEELAEEIMEQFVDSLDE